MPIVPETPPWKGLLFFVLLLFAASFFAGAKAQDGDKTYKHTFEESTVYVEVSPALVKVWSIEDTDGDVQCQMYPNVVTYGETKIYFPGGTTWALQPTDAGVDITFPNGRTVSYVHSQEEPEDVCGFLHKGT